MNKGIRLIKRLVALLLVLLLSIESFGAVVSDNDGSAFITKAEFDSLKNDFQNQIDQYNTSIDSKIDGAIASYLAGISVAKTTTKSILTKNWTSGYTMLNKVINNDYTVYPNATGNAALYWWRINDNKTANHVAYDTAAKIMNSYFNFSYSPTHTTNKRVLVTNVTSAATLNLDKMTWAGVANNAYEGWTLSEIAKTNQDPSYLENARGNITYCCQFLNLNAPGFYSTFTSTSNPIWNPGFRWAYKANNTQTTWSYSNIGLGTRLAASSIPEIRYEANSQGKTYSYEHIGNWKNSEQWEVTIKDVTNYALTSTKDGRGTAEWVTKVTNKSGFWSGCEVDHNVPAAVKPASLTTWPRYVRLTGFVVDSTTSWTDNTYTGGANDKKIPILGLISGTHAANTIYQFQDLWDEDWKKINPITLNQGIPLFQVTEGEIIEWNPIFKDLSTTATGNKYVIIKLAYVPFNNESNISTGNVNDLVKCDFTKYDLSKYGKYHDGSNFDWPRTSVYNTTSKTCEVPIKFEADRSGIVYAKFWVYTTTTATDAWEVTLDIENSNTYKSTKE